MANLKWYTNKHNGELRQFSDAWYKINTGDGKYPNPNWKESTEEEIADWLQEETDPAETVVDTGKDTGNGEQTKVVALTKEPKPAKATGGKKAEVAEIIPPAPAGQNPETPLTQPPVIEVGDGEEAKDGETSK